MSSVIKIPGYKPVLSVYETQTAIGNIKRLFEDNLNQALNLKRVSAPLIVTQASGLNDDLNGVERPVEFDIPECGGNGQIVHSLAKWKRMALHKYGFAPGEGICTDMNAIRRDEQLDNTHSIYVDQWDWEKVIEREYRTIDFLKLTVKNIVNAICDTLEQIRTLYPKLTSPIARYVKFITAQELEDLYPDLTPKERENEITKKYKTVFISQIGGKLKSGGKHDGRAPDYDDWGMNGDIFFWSEVLETALEVSSMGIRVDEVSLDRQLREAGCDSRRELPFHKALLEGELPLTIGGGIGQSRLCMLLLEKAHVGEVQVSIWDKDTVSACEENGIVLL